MTLAQVKEFNNVFEVDRATVPTTRIPADKLRFDLIAEEFDELLEAYKGFDLVEIADALGDIQYVVHGAIDVFNLEALVEELRDLPQKNIFPTLLKPEEQRFILITLKEAILRNQPKYLARVLKDILRDLDEAAAYFDLDLDYLVAVIHKSNLTKLEDGVVLRHPLTNKVDKGKYYAPPTGDIRAYLYDGVKDADLLG